MAAGGDPRSTRTSRSSPCLAHQPQPGSAGAPRRRRPRSTDSRRRPRQRHVDGCRNRQSHNEGDVHLAECRRRRTEEERQYDGAAGTVSARSVTRVIEIPAVSPTTSPPMPATTVSPRPTTRRPSPTSRTSSRATTSSACTARSPPTTRARARCRLGGLEVQLQHVVPLGTRRDRHRRRVDGLEPHAILRTAVPRRVARVPPARAAQARRWVIGGDRDAGIAEP